MTRQIVLLAGGYGTRLGERTRSTPKPLLPVAGQPFIRYLVQEFFRFGFSDVLVLAGYLADQIREHFDAEPFPGARVRVLVEPHPLGTGGALRFAQADLDDVFLLANADSLFAINYLDLARPPQAADWLGKLALRSVDDSSRYGVVSMRGDRIVDFHERGEGGSGLINAGVYFLRRAILDSIGEGAVSLEREVFPALARTSRLYGAIFDGSFIDIGVPEALKAAETEIPAILSRRTALPD